MTTPTKEPANSPPLIEILNSRLVVGKRMLARNAPWKGGSAWVWVGLVRLLLIRLYGQEHALVRLWLDALSPRVISRPEFITRVDQLERLIDSLSVFGNQAFLNDNKSVFIGHGGSKVWLELQFYLEKRLALPCSEFNTESVAGVPTSHRLDQMLDAARFAFLIMTAEDKHADGTMHARPNVIHEIGLFQGRLGARRAIILREDGCSGFSNASGLTDISFPPNHLEMAFDKIRHVLEREHILIS